MAKLVEYQLDIRGTSAGMTEAIVHYTLEDDTKPAYRKQGAVIVTDLIAGGKTLGTLRTEVIARIMAAG